MKQIELTRGYVSLVDDEDHERLSALTWYAHSSNGGIYAASRVRNTDIYMHRYIVDASPSLLVDHRNGDTLDNRRQNLREATYSQNLQNRRGATKRSKTGVRGVYVDVDGVFHAQIGIGGRRYHLGRFTSLGEATAVVKDARRRYMTHSSESDGSAEDITEGRHQSCANCSGPMGAYRPTRPVRYCSKPECNKVAQAIHQKQNRAAANERNRAYRLRLANKRNTAL